MNLNQKGEKIAQGFGGRSVRERDRDFNGKVEKVIKKEEGTSEKERCK